MKFSRIFYGLILFFIGLCAVTCGSSKNADRIAVEAVDKQISHSATLKSLDKMCRNLPVFEDFEPESKSIGRKNDIIFNYYKLQLNVDEAFSRIIERLQKDGWNLTKNEREASRNRLEFERGNYWIQVSYNAFTVLNFSTNCKDLTVSGS